MKNEGKGVFGAETYTTGSKDYVSPSMKKYHTG